MKEKDGGISERAAREGRAIEVNDVSIRIGSEDREHILDALIASWMGLMYRYQQDTFHRFSWGTHTADDPCLQCVSVAPTDMSRITTLNELVAVGHQAVTTDYIARSHSKSVFIFNDGTPAEWTFQVSVELQTQQLRAFSQWRSPTMSEYQAHQQLRTFSHILENILQHQQSPIKPLLAITNEELDTIWKRNSPLPPTLDTCMHDIISDQAQKNPGKPAVEAWDGCLTYAQVDQFSTELAQNLLLVDDKASIVPLLFEKSRWTVVALLAVMKAGKCFALLDPAQPEGRLRTIVEQTNATLIVASKTQAPLAARAAPPATIIPLSESKIEKLYHPVAEEQPKTTLKPVSSTAPLYVQFTSGSTGKPKGCLISHSQYTSGAIPRAKAVGYKAHSRVLDFASYAFDVCIDSMLCTLSHGGTLCTPSDEKRMNDLSGVIRDMKVTLAGMTPSVARTLDGDILGQLESIGLGGEGVSASDAMSWGKRTRVVNCYGPSECTVGATYNDRVGERPYITMGYGRGCVTWIADSSDHNKLVPVGAVGELLIEGPIVGLGYLNNPEKTKEVFIEDPKFLIAGSPSVPGRRGRMYKTGDLVKYDPDGVGEVIFVGRQDQQVKLRGQRIELAEIEFNMQKHAPPDTSLAAEVIKPGGSGEPVLVAFLVENRQGGMKALDGNFASFSARFQKALGRMTHRLMKDLPSYMVPSAFIPLWKMPLMVSCKTDRKRLREIGTAITRQDLRRFAAATTEKTEPTTEMELKLRLLWAKVLGGEGDFSANDNFFSMGGDSLRAMRLVAAARNEGIVLSVPDILLNPTLAAMSKKATILAGPSSDDVAPFSLLPAEWRSDDDAMQEAAALCRVPVDSIEDMYPCTPLQEGLMALSAKFADAYVAQRVVELKAEVAKKLGEAFHKTVEDCDILRTRIINIPGCGLFQVVMKEDHSAYSGSDLKQYLQQDQRRPMELGVPLFRYAVIIPSGSAKGFVVITMHHAIYDGWMMPLVVERINRAYNNMPTTRSASFKHFIRHLTKVDRSVSETYWREHLHAANYLQFPPLPTKGYTVRADSLLERYVAVPTSAHSQTTLATIIRGAWGLVSSLYLGSPDIIFGETLTGRSLPVVGVEQIEGPMITTIPFRIRLNFEHNVAHYLQDVHAQTVRTMPHEHLGLQNIRRLSRDAREACELKTGLVLHPKEDEDWTDSPTGDDAPANGFVPTNDEEAAREALKFNTYALMLVCTLDANGFLIMASFDSNCISSAAMERVLRVLERIVLKFCGNSEHLLGDVAVLDSEERMDAEKLRPKDMRYDSPFQSESEDHRQIKPGRLDSARNQEEIRLCGLLSRILNIPDTEIDLNDSFFELGGDSITAMRLVNEVKQLGSTMRVAQIFKTRSLSELAATIVSAKEDKLRDILSRILTISKDDVNGSDSFFQLGGDSISAMRLVSEAKALGLQITVPQIFKSPSVADLARAATEETTQTPLTTSVDEPYAAFKHREYSITPELLQPRLQNPKWKVTNVYPTRPLQDLAVEGTVNLPRYSIRYDQIHFALPVDEPTLRSSCQAIIDRNEILRTVFVKHEGHSLGVVLESLDAPFERVAVPSDLDLREFVQNWSRKDIELPKPHGSPFVAFSLFTASNGESILAFRISHAQYDEMCLPLLYQQLAALYTSSAVPVTEPYSRHVTHAVNTNITQSVPYWRSLLSKSTMTVLEPNIQLTSRKPMDIYREFDISARPAGITIGSLPTAAWAIVLANRLSTRDVVFGEVVSGRNIGVAGADRIFGPTWQYVPFRVPFDASWTYLDFLHFVQQQHVTSAAYEGMGFEEIVQECTNWDPERITWFDTVVHQAPEFVESIDFGGLEAKVDTMYPHAEPLREWKCQAFIKDGGKKLGVEIVTFEDWGSVAEEVLSEVGEVLGRLVGDGVEEKIFQDG
ncbi:acetyl-CoA synthetase-like protein [Lophiostoma macrostomum CBS 122681]|uniref:Acetyl-CoA synthetase-like protein n=1 Tax=Lophiostoma macrostomum CBS 122681 TaxID=1314788 RepID=A0A6A6T6A4_9PLEO|nr:acetyl-CoA synthetase-like protein [Lophiostoma macrostomum CBS 122681]